MRQSQKKNVQQTAPPTHPHAEPVEATCKFCARKLRGIIGNPEGDRRKVVFDEHLEKSIRPGNVRLVRCDGSGVLIKMLPIMK